MALQRIGNYEVLGELGRGGMGVVYRGVDSFIKRPVAIKTIYLSEIQEDHERQFLKERLYREAQSAGMLSHPNIVTIYQIGEQDDLTYIVMEFVEGKNLAQLLRSAEKPSVELLLSIFEQTAAGLDHAHAQGVIHRDVKPANIIVRSDGVAKITDFGVAKISSQTVTRTGMTLGTPHFMAPEQIQGKPVDGRADQYSLGVVIYEIFTGRKPFTADSMTTLIFKIVTDAVDPKRDNPNLNDAAAEVLKRAQAKESSDRFPSCQALVHAFRSAIGMPSQAQAGFAGSATIPSGASYPSLYTSGTMAAPSQPTPTRTGAPATIPMPQSPATGLQTPTPTPPPGISRPPQPPSRNASPAVGPPQPVPAPAPTPSATPALPPRPTPRVAPHAATPAPKPAAGNKWLFPVIALTVVAVVVLGIFGVVRLMDSGSDSKGSQIASSQKGPSGTATPSGSTSSPAKPATSAVAVAPQPTAAQPAAPPSAVAPKPSVPGGIGTLQPAATPRPSVAAPVTPVKPPVSQPLTRPGGATTPPGVIQPGARKPVAQPTPTPPGGSQTIPDPSELAPRPAVEVQKPAAQPVFTPPKPIVRVPAIYPAAARRDGIVGSVLLQALVNEAGQPTAVNVVRSIRPDLDQAAKEALAKWRFQPGTADGKPIESRINVEISFSLVQDQRKPISLKNP